MGSTGKWEPEKIWDEKGTGGGRAETPGGGSSKSMGISETGGTMLNISQSKKG